MEANVKIRCSRYLYLLMAKAMNATIKIRSFLQIARSYGVRPVKIEKNNATTKLKIQCSEYPYTLMEKTAP
jgi:hypothetical protein